VENRNDSLFYLANHELYSTPVFVEDGQFLYSRGEIGREPFKADQI
jgi:hypothetical protein